MRPRRPQRRLRLHRETVRSLSARDMVRVAGGSEVIIIDDLWLGGSGTGEPRTDPRTNAWTAEPGNGGLCGGGGA